MLILCLIKSMISAPNAALWALGGGKRDAGCEVL